MTIKREYVAVIEELRSLKVSPGRVRTNLQYGFDLARLCGQCSHLLQTFESLCDPRLTPAFTCSIANSFWQPEWTACGKFREPKRADYPLDSQWQRVQERIKRYSELPEQMALEAANG